MKQRWWTKRCSVDNVETIRGSKNEVTRSGEQKLLRLIVFFFVFVFFSSSSSGRLRRGGWSDSLHASTLVNERSRLFGAD